MYFVQTRILTLREAEKTYAERSKGSVERAQFSFEKHDLYTSMLESSAEAFERLNRSRLHLSNACRDSGDLRSAMIYRIDYLHNEIKYLIVQYGSLMELCNAREPQRLLDMMLPTEKRKELLERFLYFSYDLKFISEYSSEIGAHEDTIGIFTRV